MFLDRIERLFASFTDSERQTPSFVAAQDAIARDAAVRERFLRFAEDADLPRTRARMIELAGTLGWLSPADQRAELVRMVGDLIGRGSIGPSDIDLVCSLNKDHRLDADRSRLQPPPAQADKVNNAAALACLGSADGTRSRPEGAHEPLRCGRRARAGLPRVTGRSPTSRSCVSSRPASRACPDRARRFALSKRSPGIA